MTLTDSFAPLRHRNFRVYFASRAVNMLGNAMASVALAFAVLEITDDASANANTHSFEAHSLHNSTEEGDIPWVLAGPSPEAISAARAKLDRALQEASKQDTVGYLILPDPRSYRHVVGPGGAEINRIRKKTGTKIQVPRAQSEGEAIEIVGTKAGVEEARDIILEIVQNNN